LEILSSSRSPSTGSNLSAQREKETGRLEAFSDGIFAFAITLLVLGLRDPAQAAGAGNLAAGLTEQWPAFFAFFTSFATILIMWVNHHNIFNYIVRIDTRFMYLNGFLMMWVTLTPFTTMLVVDHMLLSDASTAALVYSGAFIALAVTFNALWRYASREHRLLASIVTDAHVKEVNRDYTIGMTGYFAAFGLALFNAFLSVVGILVLAIFFAITAASRGLGETSE
jgi:uncharacterized membrane protein